MCNCDAVRRHAQVADSAIKRTGSTIFIRLRFIASQKAEAGSSQRPAGDSDAYYDDSDDETLRAADDTATIVSEDAESPTVSSSSSMTTVVAAPSFKTPTVAAPSAQTWTQHLGSGWTYTWDSPPPGNCSDYLRGLYDAAMRKKGKPPCAATASNQNMVSRLLHLHSHFHWCSLLLHYCTATLHSTCRIGNEVTSHVFAHKLLHPLNWAPLLRTGRKCRVGSSVRHAGLIRATAKLAY
jgi:hypothetical protein